MAFPGPGPHPGPHLTFRCHVSLGYSGLWLSQTRLVFLDLDGVEAFWQPILQTASGFRLVCAFLVVTLGAMGFGEERPRGEDLPEGSGSREQAMEGLTGWVALVRALHWMAPRSSLGPRCPPWRTPSCTAPTCRGGGGRRATGILVKNPSAWETRLFSSTYLFNRLFTSL